MVFNAEQLPFVEEQLFCIRSFSLYSFGSDVCFSWCTVVVFSSSDDTFIKVIPAAGPPEGAEKLEISVIKMKVEQKMNYCDVWI